ncbi:MAG TPA: Rieske 2Fe-2S domain-containing protein [Dehalococcoidia bacterium]|nr:Rieske 2Fe-2S domain-containing protein [Dehalococcoidia bacterium]
MTTSVRRDTRVESSDFVRTGPGTLGGRYLRRFWQPVYVAADLPSGVAKPIQILGEKFTLYRGEAGTPHVVAHRCAHRGTQLSSGWVEDDCIRCLYHGWRYDASGRCVEQPGEGGEGFAARVQLAGYPTREHLGMIFAYFGEGRPPAFPPYPAFANPALAEIGVLDAWSVLFPCNYFQSYENTSDEFHVAYVHSGGGTHSGLAGVPKMFAEETDDGFVRRSVRVDGRVRVTQHLMPNTTRVIVPPFKGMRGVGGWRDSYFTLVPIDDESHFMFGMQVAAVSGSEMKQYESVRQQFLAEVAASRPPHELAGEVMAGRDRLSNYSEHPYSVNIEDIVAQAGQGTVADRTNERLGRTDVGVILMRKIWSRELRALDHGSPLKEWCYRGELPEVGL